MQNKVVCDTMIWYKIGNGMYSKSDFEGYELCATWVNIWELITTTKLLNKPHAPENALRAIYQHASCVFPYTPLEHIAALDKFKGVNSQNNEYRNKILSLGERIGKSHNYVSDLCKDEIRDAVTARNNVLTEVTSYVNQYIKPIYAFYEKEIKLKKFRRDNNFTQDIKEQIINIVNLHTGHILSEGLDWSNLEFSIKVINHYFMEVVANQSSIKPNDWGDMSNFVYINSDMLYWTDDKKGPGRYISSSDVDKYLFPQK